MTPKDLNRRLHADPFRPFNIHLSDGSAIPVDRPQPFLLGRTAAVVPTDVFCTPEGFPLFKRWRTIALSHMVRFSDIKKPFTGRRRKKR